MAVLHIPDENRTVTDTDAIKNHLASLGVWHDQWEAAVSFPPDADQETILGAYEHVLQPYMARNGYQVADVISVSPETPNLEELRAKFLNEHTHTEDEVRFFVEGEGHFWFNLPDHPVFVVICRSGDLLSVPAGTKHWFDFGPDNRVKAIRIFIDPSGWVPAYTESGVEAQYEPPVNV